MAHEHEHDREPRHHHAHPSGPVSGPVCEHRSEAPAHVATWVITCSDSRGAAEDRGGPIIVSTLEEAGHTVAGRAVVKDDPEAILAELDRAREAGARAAVLTGGTGIGPRDVTPEVVRGLLDKELPGFGEIFRLLSFQEIGSAAMLSRAVAGSWSGMVLFALPGSPHAVRLAMEKLILPELGHVVRELVR